MATLKKETPQSAINPSTQYTFEKSKFWEAAGAPERVV